MSEHLAECYLGQPCHGWRRSQKPRPSHNWTNAEQAWTPDEYCHSCQRFCECARFRACYARALEDAALAVERGCAHTKYENCYPCWHDQYAEKIRALRVQHG